jgi:chromatin segregation and condensation protein Rec8/ScpA/Scc1 (kleisin family)|tara:strand:+ start:3684 stop:4898 length:1215 start_codon:yes stop_codon:yes gene_type:complete
MAEQQSGLDKWFLRQDVIDQLLASGEDSHEAALFGDKIMTIAATEEAEHQTLIDPFDRSVALVLSLVREEELDAWNIDLSSFLKVFTARVKSEAGSLDLPACGRLIRLSWEVLHQQAEDLFERVQFTEEEEDWDDGLGFGWEADYNDEDFFFTNSILQGSADEILPDLLENRVRRDEGRPVTLVELLSAFKDASDDAEMLRLREENRLVHEEELKEYLADVDGRMHNEDLEGDIKRCWQALRTSCLAAGQTKVPVLQVMNELKPILEQAFGSVPEGYDDEAKVASFIAGLFLTHRGFASITQDSVPDGEIFLEDSWPQIKTFEEINSLIETQQATENERIQEQDSGSVRHAKLRAEKARSAEEDSIRKQERALAKQQKEQAVVEVPESNDVEEQSYDNHEWLVE